MRSLRIFTVRLYTSLRLRFKARVESYILGQFKVHQTIRRNSWPTHKAKWLEGGEASGHLADVLVPREAELNLPPTFIAASKAHPANIFMAS
jgi:hypothetical protein